MLLLPLYQQLVTVLVVVQKRLLKPGRTSRTSSTATTTRTSHGSPIQKYLNLKHPRNKALNLNLKLEAAAAWRMRADGLPVTAKARPSVTKGFQVVGQRQNFQGGLPEICHFGTKSGLRTREDHQLLAMGKSLGFKYAGKGPGLQKTRTLTKKYLCNQTKKGKLSVSETQARVSCRKYAQSFVVLQ
eukprot:1183097-Rhodomonas_salina.1